MRLALVLVAALLGFVIGLCAGGARINESHLEFVQAYNQWQSFAATISPLSPDWQEKIRTEWDRLLVSEKFELLESEIRAE